MSIFVEQIQSKGNGTETLSVVNKNKYFQLSV